MDPSTLLSSYFLLHFLCGPGGRRGYSWRLKHILGEVPEEFSDCYRPIRNKHEPSESCDVSKRHVAKQPPAENHGLSRFPERKFGQKRKVVSPFVWCFHWLEGIVSLTVCTANQKSVAPWFTWLLRAFHRLLNLLVLRDWSVLIFATVSGSVIICHYKGKHVAIIFFFLLAIQAIFSWSHISLGWPRIRREACVRGLFGNLQVIRLMYSQNVPNVPETAKTFRTLPRMFESARC